MVTQEYQTQLINSVREDIKHLHEKVHATQKKSNNQYLTFYPVQDPIPILRSLPHVTDARSTTHRRMIWP